MTNPQGLTAETIPAAKANPIGSIEVKSSIQELKNDVIFSMKTFIPRSEKRDPKNAPNNAIKEIINGRKTGFDLNIILPL